MGDISAKVPRHISVIPWVQLGDWRHEVFAEVQGIVDDIAPVVLQPGRMMTIGGEGHEKRAQRIHSEQLREMHMRMLYCLGSFGVVVSHPEWAGHRYKPHITAETPQLLGRATVDTVYAIDNTLLKPDDDRGTKLIAQSFEGSREI